jgi:hypothetical protein
LGTSVRVLPTDVPKRIARAARLAAVTALVLVSVPFLVKHLREGMFPILASVPALDTATAIAGDETVALPRGAVRTAHDTGGGEGHLARQEALQEAAQFGMIGLVASAEAEKADAPRARWGSSTSDYELSGKAKAPLNAQTYDPNAVVQTGPGLPRWSWTSVDLRWSGPVPSTQRMKLFLLSPTTNLVLALARAVLLLLVLVRLTPWIDRHLPPGWRLKLPGFAAAAAFALAIVLLPTRAFAQSYPSKELLDDLRDRLTQEPSCMPTCASASRMQIEARGRTLRARLEIDAAATTAVPLPGGADQWTPAQVLLDGRPAKALLSKDGTLWVEVGAGAHQLLIEGPLPERESVQIALPLKPHRVDAATQGWTVEGLHEDGLADDNLQLTRSAAEAGGAGAGLQAGTLPAFVRVERTLHLGLNWEVETRVARVTPSGSAVVLEVPLLPGESVTTADVRVAAGKALVNMGPSQREVAWRSVLEQKSPLPLIAPKTGAWAEIWRLDLGPIWHAEPRGIPVVHTEPVNGVRVPEWHPWPGEEVSLEVVRPEGVTGQALTIDKVAYDVRPGLRATDATLELTIRASRGLQHTVTLPEGATLESIARSGVAQPIRQEGRKVTFPISPGAQTVRLAWREPRALSPYFRASEVDLGAPAVNVSTTIAALGERWVLLLGGPRYGMGPVVLFWSSLGVLLVFALALSRVRWTQVKTWQWALLALGLSQVSALLAAIAAGWLLALGWRKERVQIQGGALAFDLRQIALAIWTVAALTVFVAAVQRGLLGAPEMQIEGNGASASSLVWYADRSQAALTTPWVLSAPMLVYRAAMLAWALWLALAVVTWLRWGWGAFTTGGAWRALPKIPRPPAPPPPAAPPPESAPLQDPAAPPAAATGPS